MRVMATVLQWLSMYTFITASMRSMRTFYGLSCIFRVPFLYYLLRKFLKNVLFV